MFVLTETERDFVVETIKEIYNHTYFEYYEEEVEQAIEILEKLKPVDTEVILTAMEKRNNDNSTRIY